jgi:hypothetical protein
MQDQIDDFSAITRVEVFDDAVLTKKIETV